MKRHIFLESLKIRKKESVLLAMQCILMFLMIITLSNIVSVKREKVTQLDQTTTSLHKIADNFVLEEESKFFSQVDNVLLLKEFYEWEKNNSMWTYLIANRQNVGVLDKKLDKIFEYGYEVRQRTEGTYKSIQINNNFFEHFSINISEGRKFLQEDYIVDEGLLPILLGNEYRELFDLNEEVRLQYLGIELDCEVVGFLDKNSYFNDGYNLELLDYYIIIPSIEKFTSATSSDDQIRKFELKLYLDKCSGYIISDINSNFLQTQISKKCYELDFLPYSLEGLSNYYPTMWGIEGKQLGKILSCFAILVVINSILCISLNMMSKISMLVKVYAIYIMNGVSKNEVIGAVIEEVFFVVLISEIVAAVISFFYWGQIPIGKMILYYFIICFLSCIYPWRMLRKVKLSLIINEQENA